MFHRMPPKSRNTQSKIIALLLRNPAQDALFPLKLEFSLFPDSISLIIKMWWKDIRIGNVSSNFSAVKVTMRNSCHDSL